MRRFSATHNLQSFDGSSPSGGNFFRSAIQCEKIDGHATGNGAIHHREFPMASGEMSGPEYVTFLRDILSLMIQYSANGSVHYLCMDWHIGDLISVGKQICGKVPQSMRLGKG